jgi:glucose-6-phosphate dehydrogenase assembly protein OpcA
MPIAYKVLGQAQPTANTLTTVYTVPSSTSTILSTIVVSNPGPTATTYRIAVRPAGESIAQKHYIAYDISVPTLDSIAMTLGITLTATDVVSVESFSGLVSFNLFGSEIS